MDKDTSILVSIITVVRNAEATIAPTIESVVALKDPDIEFIVFDGQSTDGTMEALMNYRDGIDRLVSARDHGVYDAMNKAIAMASGKFILHMNEGDRLIRIPRQELLTAPEEAAVVAFPVRDGKHTFVPTSNWRLQFTNTIHHQGAFYRRKLLEPYNIRYRTYADFDLNQRLQKKQLIVCLPGTVAEHDPGGMSCNPSAFGEMRSVIRGNFGFLFYLVQPLYNLVAQMRQNARDKRAARERKREGLSS